MPAFVVAQIAASLCGAALVRFLHPGVDAGDVVVPHEHVADFAATSEAQRDELALLYLRLLRGVDALYHDPTPYIAAWHQAPVRSHRDSARLHLRLMSPRRARDKLKYQAGSESGMGAWIGDIPPEAQAERLRAAIARADQANPA